MNKEQRNALIANTYDLSVKNAVILTKLLEELGYTTSVEGLPEKWSYEDLGKCLKVKKEETTPESSHQT